MEQKLIKRRKTRWSFHSFNIGDKKTFSTIDMPKFRTALSIWNKKNPDNKIDYEYQPGIVRNTYEVTRIS